MDGVTAIVIQAATGGVPLAVAGLYLFRVARKAGRMEEKLDNACGKLDNLECSEHNTRLAKIEGYIEGRNGNKKGK